MNPENVYWSPYAMVFLNACDTGDTTELGRLLAEGQFLVNEDIIMSQNDSAFYLRPIFVAAFQNSIPVLTFLLEHGADPDARNGRSLNHAVRSWQLDVARFLLDKGANPNIPEANNLKESVLTGHLDMVQLLLGRGADVRLNDFIALRTAMCQSRPDILELVLDHAEQLTKGDDYLDSDGEAARKLRQCVQLCKAVLKNDVDEIGELLKTGAYASYADIMDTENSATSLSYQITKREVSKIFVSAGVEVKNIYLSAVTEGDKELHKFCLASPNFDLKVLNFDAKILSDACVFNRLEVIKHLVNEYQLKLDEVNRLGDIPILNINDPYVLRSLIDTFPELNLNVSIRTVKTNTTMLKINSNCEFYAILLENGANPWLNDTDNRHIKMLNSDGEDECDYGPNCAVVQHLQKLSLIDLQYAMNIIPAVLDVKLNDFEDFEWFNLRKECENELTKMREVRISLSTSEVSGKNVFDFIFLGANEAALYAKNIEVLKIYEEHKRDFSNYFPHYGFVLNRQLRRAQTRRNLVESALEILREAFGTDLPEDFAEMIFGFFSNLSLKQFNLKTTMST